ncbi:PTS sugar transporter subunit IIA [Exiguobacterium sp. MER 193]|uniref:BglG family transcription antiterminator n=1 Tax=Exiguobacterium sp. MER 193 TaxID=2939564 RepID=UPI00203F308F|nr:PTS sugar transporter subunit IIA [Exiguobacterium sp. MER 193]MCM3281833.1 PTS sugar transporter subunit IIA [Exiguobacterium sp. MER 193]
MHLTYRQLSMAEVLYYLPGVTVTNLANQFLVTRKTIYTDIETIRHWLKDTQLGSLLKDELGRYSIRVSTPSFDERLGEEMQAFRSYEIGERQAVLLYLLFTRLNGHLEDFMEELQVSRNTVLNDLATLRDILSHYQVNLIHDTRAYRFEGEEIIVRRTLINLLSPYTQKLHRIGLLKETSPVTSQASHMYQLAKQIQSIRIAQGHSLTAPFNEAEYDNVLQKGLSIRLEQDTSLDIATTFVKQLSSLIHIEIDPRAIPLIHAHLTAALYRHAVGIVYPNPLYKDVLQQFPHMFRLIKVSLRTLITTRMSKDFEEQEASFLTLLVNSHLIEAPHRKLTIACYEGTTISYSIREQLIKAGVTAEMIECRSFENIEHADVLITTTAPPRDVAKKDWIRVAPILTEADLIKLKPYISKQTFNRQMILRVVKRNVSEARYRAILNEIKVEEQLHHHQNKGDYPIMLRDLLTEETIHVTADTLPWEEAVRLAARPLLETKRIEPGYVDAVIENIHANGAYMVLRDDFALPHARPSEQVNELSMSLLVLRESIPFSNEEVPVNVIVFLAAVDTDSHLHALSELIELLSDNPTFDAISQAKTPDEILSIFQEEEQL